MRRVSRSVLVAGLALLLVAPAASALAARPALSADQSAPSAIGWGGCEGEYPGVQCARLSVPVDWSKPTGPRISLSLARRAATGANRIGTLFFAPGGPGESGVSLVTQATDVFSKRLLERFDLVSWDPRGYEGSAPVLCSFDENAPQPLSPFVRSAAELTAFTRQNRAMAEDCRRHTKDPVLGQLGSDSSVRDLEAFRAAAGLKWFRILGVSYGTLLGHQYAAAHPDRVRALVLDSVEDHAVADEYLALERNAVDFEGAYHLFDAWCQRTSSCQVRTPGAKKVYAELYARAAQGTLPGYRNAEDFAGGVSQSMRSMEGWPDLAAQLAEARVSARGARPARTGDPQLIGAGRWPVRCQDWNTRVRDYPQLADWKTRLAKAAPTVRLYPEALEDVMYCLGTGLKVANPPAEHRVSGLSTGALLVNSRYDVATPYAGAVRAAGLIAGSRLLTYQGAGHFAYGQSGCVRDAVDSYLLTGVLPAAGKKCPAVFPAGANRGR